MEPTNCKWIKFLLLGLLFYHVPIDRLNELLHCTTLGYPHLDDIGEGEIHVDHIEILVCRICYNLRNEKDGKKISLALQMFWVLNKGRKVKPVYTLDWVQLHEHYRHSGRSHLGSAMPSRGWTICLLCKWSVQWKNRRGFPLTSKQLRNSYTRAYLLVISTVRRKFSLGGGIHTLLQ